MTIEEAKSCICTIKMLQRLAYNIHGVMDVIDADNCKKIIKALEQEPCEDCISREQAINVLSDALKGVFVEHEDVAEKILSKVPSVTPQPFINKPCVSEGVCREDKIQVLDKIRTEIKAMSGDVETLSDVLDVIDKHLQEIESEEKN